MISERGIQHDVALSYKQSVYVRHVTAVEVSEVK
jgi:hypothetical protein